MKRVDGRAAPVVSRRWPGVWSAMAERGLDALIVYGRGAVGQYGFVCYTTGAFPPPKGAYAVMRRNQRPLVVVPSPAEARAMEAGVGQDVEVACAPDGSRRGLLKLVAAHAREAGSADRIGLAAGGGQGLPAYAHEELLRALDDARVVPADDLLYRLKARLSPEDAEGLREGAAVADAGLAAFHRSAHAGMTEWEGAAIIEAELRKSGALTTLVHVASVPFVGQGPTARRIEDGDVVTVVVELATADGYWVEVGALFGCGPVAADRRRVAHACIGCLRESRDLLVPGAAVAAVAQHLIGRIGESGGEPVVGLGHAVGIDEGMPVVSPAAEAAIQPSSGFAIHPSIAASGSAYAVANTYVVELGSTRAVSDYPLEFHRFARRRRRSALS